LLAAEGMVDVHLRSGKFCGHVNRRDLEETFDISAPANAWLQKKQ